MKVERALARAARRQERRAADRDRLRALVLAAHNATRRCERLCRRSPGQPLDLRALSAALESAATAVSRARNRAVLDARAETEEREP